MSPKKISKFISTSIKSLNQKRRKPEIIAVLCVHNEQLNIDTCLYHLEPYVEKIVILDDGSTELSPVQLELNGMKEKIEKPF